MKKKAIILTVVIIAVLVLIAGMIFLIGGKDKSTNNKNNSLGEIVYVEFLYDGEEQALVKKKGTWQWDEEPDLSLDQEGVAKQIETLEKSLGMEKIGKKKLKECGLEDPETRITIKDAKGKKMTVYIGSMFDADSYYARMGNGNEVYIVSGKVMDMMDSLSAQKIISEQMDSVTSATVEEKIEQ